MADLSITAASVARVSGDTFTDTSAVALTAGQTIYKDVSVPGSEVMRLADADASSTAANIKGIALHACAAGQPINYQISGDITIGATLTRGQIYVVSNTAGGISPVSDLTTNWYTSIVGVGKSSTVLQMGINAWGRSMPNAMRPPAGEMNTPITILSDVESPDSGGYGEAVSSRTPRKITDAWAKVEPQNGREFYRASQMYGVLSHVLTIDFLKELTVKMKVLLSDQGRTLNIVGIVDEANQGIVQHVACVEAV